MQKSTDPIDINLTSARDALDFAALVHEMDIFYGTPIPETVEETAAFMVEAGIGPKAPIEALLARHDGIAVGFASFSKIFPADDGRLGVQMKDLFILPGERGQGIGGMLIRALANLCQERGYKRLFWTTTHENDAAIRLYDSLGAERQNEKLHYRLNTAAIARLSESE
jgi:ribosomal protein S18 acetylase RimI-like enzyme